MSKGPGAIEKRIAELFTATKDRGLSIGEIASYAFDLKGAAPTRPQRLSATRAAHRVVKRAEETHKRAHQLRAKAYAATIAAFGRKPAPEDYGAFQQQLTANPDHKKAEELFEAVKQMGGCHHRLAVGEGKGWFKIEDHFWRATPDKNGRLFFHPVDVPIRVWAVQIRPTGVVWAEAEIVNITERNVMVRYADDVARLDRKRLWESWSVWRGVNFVCSQTGAAAQRIEARWHERYGSAPGGPPPAMRMPLAEARAVIGVSENFTREEIISAFRRKAKEAHPDAGGTEVMFHRLVEARDRLLASIGTSEPAPKAPQYAPSGAKVIYHRVKPGGPGRLGATKRLASG